MSYGDNPTPDEVKAALSRLRTEELKTVVKEAIKEWLDEQAILIGKWSFRFFLLSVLGALTYFVLNAQGWTHK